MTLGDRLREARVYQGLTQTEVSKRSGINFKTLSNWEHNVSRPSTDDIVVLAKIYKTSSDELLGIIPIFGDSTITNEFGRMTQEAHKQMDMIAAYKRAPQAVRDIVDIALRPYMKKALEKEA